MRSSHHLRRIRYGPSRSWSPRVQVAEGAVGVDTVVACVVVLPDLRDIPPGRANREPSIRATAEDRPECQSRFAEFAPKHGSGVSNRPTAFNEVASANRIAGAAVSRAQWGQPLGGDHKGSVHVLVLELRSGASQATDAAQIVDRVRSGVRGRELQVETALGVSKDDPVADT